MKRPDCRHRWPQGHARGPEHALPASTLQTGIVHLIRNSLDYASYTDRKALAAAFKPIYRATSAEAAQAELRVFAEGPWAQKSPTITTSWRRAWQHMIPLFAVPAPIRRVIYTTHRNSDSTSHCAQNARRIECCRYLRWPPCACRIAARPLPPPTEGYATRWTSRAPTLPPRMNWRAWCTSY